MARLKALPAFLLLSIGLLLAACGDGGDQAQSEAAPAAETATASGEGGESAGESSGDIYAEAEAFYAANPDFFVFASPDDLPSDLVWENGMEFPPFASPEAKQGGTHYMAIQDFPRTLRHVGPDSNGSFRGEILDDLAVGLVGRHPNLDEYIPGLANEWAVSQDDHTVYIRLDPDARWSDGEPVTADDFVFMFFFYRTEYIVAPWYNDWYATRYNKIVKYDDRTFAIQTAEARPFFEEFVFGLNGVPAHFYDELGEDYTERYQWRFVPTTGAYEIRDEDDLRKGRSIIMHKVDDWWAEDKKFFQNRFNPERKRYTVIRDSAKSFEAFKKGELDMAGLTLAEFWYDRLPNDDELVQNGYVHKSVFYNEVPRPNWGVWMNRSKPLLDNRDIRIGINYAMNWEKVIDGYFRGDAVRMRTRSDGHGDFTHPTLRARPFSIDQAQEHFAKAGFTERGPDGVLVNEAGTKLAFTLTTGYERMKDVLTILKEEALKAGLELRIEVLDGTTAFKKVQEKNHDLSFTAFNIGVGRYPTYHQFYHSLFAYDEAFLEDGSVNPDREVKRQTNNLSMVAIKELDDLIDQYEVSTDLEEMREIAFKVEEILHEDASFVPAFVIPFYRVGHWRWMQFPEGFNVKFSRDPLEYNLHWIDEAVKEETLDAMRRNEAFEPQIREFDQYAGG